MDIVPGESCSYREKSPVIPSPFLRGNRRRESNGILRYRLYAVRFLLLCGKSFLIQLSPAPNNLYPRDPLYPQRQSRTSFHSIKPDKYGPETGLCRRGSCGVLWYCIAREEPFQMEKSDSTCSSRIVSIVPEVHHMTPSTRATGTPGSMRVLKWFLRSNSFLSGSVPVTYHDNRNGIWMRKIRNIRSDIGVDGQDPQLIS